MGIRTRHNVRLINKKQVSSISQKDIIEKPELLLFDLDLETSSLVDSNKFPSFFNNLINLDKTSIRKLQKFFANASEKDLTSFHSPEELGIQHSILKPVKIKDLFNIRGVKRKFRILNLVTDGVVIIITMMTLHTEGRIFG